MDRERDSKVKKDKRIGIAGYSIKIKKMKASAFAPCHITGFFEIVERKEHIKTGSKGCGVVLEKGVFTAVRLNEGDSISVYVNGEPCSCPVTTFVAEKTLGLSGKKFQVEILHEIGVPLGYGLGTSGACALSTAIAMNKALGLNLTMNQCGAIAHQAEVVNKTGLGDVIAELNGGLVIRTQPGAPGIGSIDKIPYEGEVVVFLIGPELKTKKILEDEERKEKINDEGRKCLKSLLEKPTPENFLLLSKEFAIRSGLIKDEVLSAIDALENEGITASMAMLGNSVFTLSKNPEEITEKLDYIYLVSSIDNIGARLT